MTGLERFYRYWLNLTLLLTLLSMGVTGSIFYHRFSSLHSQSRKLYQTMLEASLRKDYSRIAEEIFLRLDTLEARRQLLQDILGTAGSVELSFEKGALSRPPQRLLASDREPLSALVDGDNMTATMAVAFDDAYLGNLVTKVHFRQISPFGEIFHSWAILFLLIFLISWLTVMWMLKRQVLTPLAQTLREESEAAVAGKIAQQVAHDIRSPLSMLNILIDKSPELPVERRQLAKRAIQRINDIARDLQKRNQLRPEPAEVLAGSLLVHLNSAIECVLSEKRIQLGERAIEIQFQQTAASYGLFVKFDSAEFKRMLSNLINNSLDAVRVPGGRVEVSLAANATWVSLCIEDNGDGIPQNVLKSIGRRGYSYGKAEGSGLGLYSAVEAVQKAGGKLLIDSQPRRGTRVKIDLPLAPAPEWFQAAVPLRRDVIVLDDDKCVHQAWKLRFAELRSKTREEFNVHYLTRVDDLRELAASFVIQDAQFLINYDLSGAGANGLDLIEELHLKSAVLITSLDEEPMVQQRCVQSAIGMVPKSSIHLVPFELPHLHFENGR